MVRNLFAGGLLVAVLLTTLGQVSSETGQDTPASASADSGWDWGDPEAFAEPAPGGREDATDAGGSAAEAPVDDWGGDWGGDWGDAAGPAPGGSTREAAAEPEAADEPDPQPVGARPDYAAEPRVGLALFPGSPEFQVIPSTKDPDMHPCLDCHEWAESDRTPRRLDEPHDDFALVHGLHGEGEFWCFTCHHLEGDGGLRTLEGVKMGFDEAYVICSQCHSQEARDWVFGAHGKRVGGWRGERRILNCTACHYQHAPALAGRAPVEGPPPMRQGLSRPPPPEAGAIRVHGEPKPWEKGSGGH